MIDAVLFDCWGTLLQAPDLMRRGSSVEYFHRFLSSYGIEIDQTMFKEAYLEVAKKQHEEAMKDLREFDYVKRIDSTLRMIGLSDSNVEALSRRAWMDYLSEWIRQSEFYPETPGLISSLKGDYKLGLVTNFPDGPTAKRVFERFGFKSMFGSMIVSAEVGFRKPKRILFEEALSGLGSIPEKSVMIGDTFDADVLGAKSIGMKAVFIDTDGSQPENHHLADAVVRNIGEVEKVLSRL